MWIVLTKVLALFWRGACKKHQTKARACVYGICCYYQGFLALNKYVTLMADVMFVKNTTFKTTMYHGIKFVAVEHIPSRTANHQSKELKIIMDFNSRCGTIVKTYFNGSEI